MFVCTECGTQQPRWLGRCPGCGAWQSLVEKAEQTPGVTDADARDWVERAREALRGNVPADPPMAMITREAAVLAGVE